MRAYEHIPTHNYGEDVPKRYGPIRIVHNKKKGDISTNQQAT